jgi:hypothetical protein
MPIERMPAPSLFRSSVRALYVQLNSLRRCERGGAIVEFIALALPLFLPLFIYLNQYGVISNTETSLRILAREVARGVVSSENDEVAFRVANEIFLKGGEALGFRDEISRGTLRLELNCKESPCISPENEIEVTIFSSEINRDISAVEYVSPWA